MKSGFIPKDGPAPDEVIKLSERSANPPEDDPDDGSIEAEGEPSVGLIGSLRTGRLTRSRWINPG